MFDKNKLIENLDKAVESLNFDLAKVRTGRAHPDMLESVKVEAYGTLTPLNQVANINVAEARQLTVKTFDPSLLKDVEDAILNSDLGLNPTNDGEILRINIPALTEETRILMVKDVKSFLEEAKVRNRNARQDAMNKIKKDDEMSEDEKRGFESEIEEEIKKYNKILEDVAKKKEEDVMTI